jgi:RNA ligase
VVAVKEGYTVINYNVMMADTFDCSIRRECRGIIFDTATGDIIRRPFHKFFNVNERDETQDHVVDLSRDHSILEKLDGSMIAPFIVNGEMIWGTKMGATDVAKPVEKFIEAHSEYRIYAKFMLSRGYTPIFEWCSRKQRIVLDYSEDQLILTAVRDVVSGRYMSRDLMIINAENYNIPVVRQFDSQTDMKEFIDYVRNLEDLEGFVVRFDDGHMIKLKCDWYVQIHKAKEAILQDRNIVELILDDKLDDIKAHLPAEDRDRLTYFESQINSRILDKSAHLSDATNREQYMGDRKYFALNRAQEYNSYSKAIVFALWDDNSYERSSELVRRTIRNNIGRNTKWEELRDHWFEGVIYNV